MKLNDFSAVIFDLDGLVLDTEATYQVAWQRAAQYLGYELSDEFCQSLSGLSGSKVTEKLLNECGADLDLTRFNELAGTTWRDHVTEQGIAIKQGFLDLLDFIQQQNLPYCLATNSRRINALECLALAGLHDVFELIISRDDVIQAKPCPDIFLTAAKQLKVEVSRCLVLEDSHTGVFAASQAGAFVCYVPSTEHINSATLELCHYTLPNLQQVLYALNR